MKTLKIIWLFCLALVFCAGNLAAQNIAPFSIEQYEHTIPAFPGNQSVNTKMEISLSLAGTKNAKLAKLVYSVLYEGLNPKQYADKLFNDDEYQKAMAEYPEMAEWAGNWMYDETHQVTVNGSYAIITRTIYVYSGGAHGNTAVQYFVVNTKKPELIVLDTIVTAANMQKLKEIVKLELKAYLESIGIYYDMYYDYGFDISNYFPVKEGLCFSWSPYEVAPYAVGVVQVVIPWKEAEGLLNSKGKALAKAFK
jgi:hypothetical protein